MQVLVQGLVPGGTAEASALVNLGDEIVGINHVLVRDLGLGMHARNPLALFFLVWF
jgi:C-terminal processing protease CtpA/Prc